MLVSPDAPVTARKILVYGVTGSGKSVAATRIGAALGAPVHLVDEEIGWLPGWVQRPVAEQRAIAERLAAAPAWVFDSAYGNFRDLVLLRADLIVGLDYPRWLSLQRLVRRTLHRIVDRKPICNGNIETVRAALSQDSILRWHFRSFAAKRQRMRGWAADPDGQPIVLFRRPRDLAAWLDRLGSVDSGSAPGS